MHEPSFSSTEFALGARSAAKMFHDLLYTPIPEPNSRPNSRSRPAAGSGSTSQARARRRTRNSESLVSQLLSSPATSGRFESSLYGNNEDLNVETSSVNDFMSHIDPRRPSYAYCWGNQLVSNTVEAHDDFSRLEKVSVCCNETPADTKWSESVRRDSAKTSEFSSIRRTSQGISSRKVSNEDSGIALEKSPKIGSEKMVEENQEEMVYNGNFAEKFC